jgi:hypothetical protein
VRSTTSRITIAHSRHLTIVPRTCRSIDPKTASIDTPLNLDTLPRAPLGVAERKHFEF